MFRKFSGGGKEIEYKTLYNCCVISSDTIRFVNLYSNNNNTSGNN